MLDWAAPKFLTQLVWEGRSKICFSNLFPGDAVAAGLGTTF